MDSSGRPIRGSRVVICISKTSNAATVLSAAVAKFAAHDWKFDASQPWTLRYPDGTLVQQLPEGNGVFRLDEYKQQVMKEYGRITLYISADGELDLCLFSSCYLSHCYSIAWDRL